MLDYPHRNDYSILTFIGYRICVPFLLSVI
jgi:hypothetical protein